MQYRSIGMLAHVDAGKTTLTEGLLYEAGMLRKKGRVDHGDAFLDYNSQEKQRGITIFSKQAIISYEDFEITLIDTPGHVDFSTEMERTLQVLDYAILVISGVDGIQAHTETIWRLLKHYHIPTFIFINKMDIAYRTKEDLIEEIGRKLDTHCIDFTDQTHWLENVAMCEDALLEQYMEKQTILEDTLQFAIKHRKVFPCYFGSALQLDGIKELLAGITKYTADGSYPIEFGAKTFKITSDTNGNRLTHMKITGGTLKTKTRLTDGDKVDQIRKYSGVKYQAVQEVHAGEVCAVSGLQRIQAGDGLGFEAQAQKPVLTPYMCYRILPLENMDTTTLMKYLQRIQDEDPQLQVTYLAEIDQIQIQVMGEIQVEILRTMLLERFHANVRMEKGDVSYRETITAPVEGVGHYEPLMHYAEVHLLLEPAPRGSGLQFLSSCPQDQLDGHYQRLILSHLKERMHRGVLTGSAITDMKITLLGGKAHKKHTEGGDFREATYRAVRHGLKMASCSLLEPYYQYRLLLPSNYVSRAMYDIEKMHGTCHITQGDTGICTLTGSAPVKSMQHYAQQVRSYTKGEGVFFCSFQGYEPCVDEQEVIKQIAYDSERDIEHPTGSVFCKQQASYSVKWDEVYEHMHMKHLWEHSRLKSEPIKTHTNIHIDDAELERVVRKIHGPQKQREKPKKQDKQIMQNIEVQKQKKVYLLVDGYNMIFSWKELKELAKTNMEAARNRLIDMLCNYQGYKQQEIILVFDAYKVDDNAGDIRKQDTIYIAYTKTKQTADSYIEKITHEISKTYRVIVATSDAMEQLIVMGQGAQRISARELERDLYYIHQKEQAQYTANSPQYRNHALEDIRKLNEENE